MAVREFRLPDPGEGLTEADIVTWHVAVGDTVKVNDVIVEIETAKSLVELPVPFAGTVTALLVEEGDTVEVGTPIIAVDDGVGGSPEDSGAGGHQARPEEADDKRTPVLVGYGVRQAAAKRRPRRKDALKKAVAHYPDEEGEEVHAHDRARAGELVAAHSTHVLRDRRPLPELAPTTGTGNQQVHVLAKPPVRKLAKDLGVDLASVRGSGADGVITRSDVEAAAGVGGGVGGARSSVGMPSATVSEPGAGEHRIPVKGVRKMMAQAMVASAFTAPHVTEWVTIDMSATMDLVERLRGDREFEGVKVSPLLVVAKAMCIAVRRNPGVNATWDEQAAEIVVKDYVNLGVAAATPRGLVVPNIKGAQSMSLRELADSLASLTETAREGRTPPAEMSDGTITVTNVGVFGVDGGTPIINPGESAILAVGAVRRKPWVVTAADGGEAIEPRWVADLALSFDHRLIDGELGSRYLADVAALLSDPTRALVWG